MLPKGWTLERLLLVATFGVSSVAFVFGVGVNWARVTDQGARIDALPDTYVRSDVYASDQRRLSEAIERLNENLDKLDTQLFVPPAQAPRARQPVAQPPGRMFDR